MGGGGGGDRRGLVCKQELLQRDVVYLGWTIGSANFTNNTENTVKGQLCMEQINMNDLTPTKWLKTFQIFKFNPWVKCAHRRHLFVQVGMVGVGPGNAQRLVHLELLGAEELPQWLSVRYLLNRTERGSVSWKDINIGEQSRVRHIALHKFFLRIPPTKMG